VCGRLEVCTDSMVHKVGAQAEEVHGRLAEEVRGRILSTVLLQIHMKWNS
jgi:hypothetical protein